MQYSMFRMALLLGALSVISPFAVDMYLPALPRIAADLHSSQGAAQATLTVYILCFGLAQMLYGPMADAWGRRRPLVLGLAVFLAGSIAAAFAPDMETLLLARAIQGFGGATLMVVPRAVIRDLSTGPDAARMMATIMMVISVSPMLAPLAGSGVIALASWRWIFGLLSLASVIGLALVLFRLPETLAPEHRRPVRPRAMAAAMGKLLRDRDFMGLTFIGGFGMASFMVFLAAASFVYTQDFGLSPTGFSLAFAVNAIGFFTASQFAGRLGEMFTMQRVIALAVTGFAATILALAALVWAGFGTLPVVMAGLFVGNAFLGLVIPSAMVLALDPHPEIAGFASSLGGTLQMFAGGLMIPLLAPFLNGTALPMVGGIALCAVLAWVAAFLTLPRLRLF